MLTDEIAAAVARFFVDGKGPPHDELTRQFQRVGLHRFDPLNRVGETVGKMKRVREVLSCALDHEPAAGAKLVPALLGAARAAGTFRTDSPAYPGPEIIRAAREAFRGVGYDLDAGGNLRPIVLENLTGRGATEALWAYVRRARTGSDDAALGVGTGKDLLEASARHVLVQITGGYSSSADFPTTLYHAFDRLGLAANPDMLKLLDKDPARAMEQSLYLLANAISRLRNAQGTGHGRPAAVKLDKRQARIALQAMGIISQALLEQLDGLQRPAP